MLDRDFVLTSQICRWGSWRTSKSRTSRCRRFQTCNKTERQQWVFGSSSQAADCVLGSKILYSICALHHNTQLDMSASHMLDNCADKSVFYSSHFSCYNPPMFTGALSPYKSIWLLQLKFTLQTLRWRDREKVTLWNGQEVSGQRWPSTRCLVLLEELKSAERKSFEHWTIAWWGDVIWVLLHFSLLPPWAFSTLFTGVKAVCGPLPPTVCALIKLIVN